MRFLLAILALLLSIPNLSRGQGDIAFVVEGEDGKNLARVITHEDSCPGISFSGKASPMTVRAMPKNARRSAFPVLVCEAAIPEGAKSIVTGKTRLPIPVHEPRRIVVIGDTGCRMKGTTFQDCSDPQAWPFRQISMAATAFKPDLVIHVGDYLYREAPCPGKCAESPHGYGFDAWDADFFSPAKALLESAPWVFVRGNHESCFRAGQGWFRFLAQEPFSISRSCDDPAGDAASDYSEPYSIPIRPDTQLIVFDSSKSPDSADRHYFSEFEKVDMLAKKFPHGIFLSHHPVLGFSEWHSRLYPGSNALQSAMRESRPGRLFPPGIDAAIHGHVHLFEALDFRSGYPATFVAGNSGTSPDEALPGKLPPGAEPFPGAVVQQFFSTSNFGFMTLERQGSLWFVTERDKFGKPEWSCALQDGKCVKRYAVE